MKHAWQEMDLGRDYWVSASLARLFRARSTSSAFWLRPSTSGVPCRRSLSISLAVLLTQLTHFSRFPSLLSISFLPSSHIPSLLPSLTFPRSLSSLFHSSPLFSPSASQTETLQKKKLVEVPRGRPLHPSPTMSRCPFFFAEIEASFPHGVSQAMSSARAITRHSKRRGGTTRANDRNAATCHGS